MTPTRFDICLPGCPQNALDVLENEGTDAWFVGPCVRNALLERPVGDWDIATDDQTGSFERGLLDYGFTIDALAYHPKRGLLDYWGGYEDLAARRIRTIGNAEERFAEDGLRILKGCRLASQLGFSIEPTTLQTMTSYKMRLTRQPAARIVDEMDALLLGEHVHDALMQTIDVLCAIMPEIAACKNFEHRSPYHIYDVWEHIAWVVQRCPATRLARWAALFHDIGKPAACYMQGKRARFFGHAYLSVLLAQSIMERLEMPSNFIERVLALVQMHDDAIEATPESVEETLHDLGEDVELLKTLFGIKKADALAHSELGKPRYTHTVELERVLDELLSEAQ